MNPRKTPGGNELCDVLVVCEPDIIVFSVKNISLTTSGYPEVDFERWKRRAVEKSCAQLYGAERTICSATNVIRNDGTAGLAFPKGADSKIHRIAVAVGGERKAGLPFGDFGKGFVHVFDEVSISILMKELNTITDFVRYLRAKESFFNSGVQAVVEGAEEDLLALYLHLDKTFPDAYDRFVFQDGLWEQIQNKPEVQRKQIADKDSYVWDSLIEKFCEDTLQNNLEFAPEPSETERAIRMMAREDRFSRRVLGKSFKEFLDESLRVRSRKMRSPSGVTYVFLATPHGHPRELRTAELGNRCFVARGLHPESARVVGLATEQYVKGKGFSLDLCHLYVPQWTAKDQEIMEGMRGELGYFRNPRVTHDSEDEYPSS